MKLLSSHDEILLLAILRLKDNAYGMTIRREVSKATGKNWSIGAIYDPLYRMEKKVYWSLFYQSQRRRGEAEANGFLRSVKKESRRSSSIKKPGKDYGKE